MAKHMKQLAAKNKLVKKWDKKSGRDKEGSLWELDYNKSGKRYDLVMDGSLNLSHVSPVPCLNRAKARGVLFEDPKKDKDES